MQAETSTQPLVSIVLPTYNRAALLGGAIESCLQQTWEHLELIVVDDGSSDNTSTVARQWGDRDQRVRYVRQENGRIPRALNTGFNIARGEFFTWTSDDNFYEPPAIELMARYLQSHPEVGLVYCDYKEVDKAGQVLGTSRRLPPEAIDRQNVVGACFMYRRSVAAQVGAYDPETFLAEDYDYWLRISKVAPLAHLSGETPYRYRLHPASLTSQREAEVELQAARVRAKHVRTERERRAVLAGGYCSAGTELRKIGMYTTAVRHYARAIYLNPRGIAAYRGLAAACLGWRPRG